MTCKGIFKVDEEFHSRNRKCINDMVEHGGNCVLDFSNKLVLPAEAKTGGYNFVNMPRGIIDWHSHPRRCKSNSMCAIGLPSPMDMVNIVLGAMHGTKAHLVYSHEGTYLVQVREEILKQLRESPCYFKMYEEKIKAVLEALHQEFLDAHLRQYRKYIQEWLVTAEKLGFTVHLFPKDTCPEIPLQYECGLVGKHFFNVNAKKPDTKSLICSEESLRLFRASTRKNKSVKKRTTKKSRKKKYPPRSVNRKRRGR